MKCKYCNGTGTIQKIIYEDWQKDEIVRSAVKCTRCNGNGEVQMTNEEWFCGLSTEEKAKAIVCLAHNASALAIEYHCADSDVEAICIWLKGVHKE